MNRINNQKVQDPVIVLGAARSGTKILRDTIATHPSVVAIPYDINFVWKYGQYAIKHDELVPSDLTEHSRNFIHDFFDRFQRNHPNTRVIEKTVSNTVRVDYVNSVFPNCQFIHLIRDGRDVAVSSMQQWQAPLNRKAVIQKLKHFPIRAFPNYAFQYALAYFFRMISREKRVATWGVRVKNLDKLLTENSLLEVCGIQWDKCVNSTVRALENVTESRKIEIRYEHLAASPSIELQRILDFLHLDVSEELLSYMASHIQNSNVNKWEKSINPSELDKLMTHISKTSHQLGYLVSHEYSHS